jgi:hypothetical protein
MNTKENTQEKVESVSNLENELRSNEGDRFSPVIAKITKPLKPQGIHAGRINVSISGNF